MANDQHRKKLGAVIREYRESSNLTQETLAEHAELTAKFLGEVERGHVNVSIDSLVRLAKALKVRVADLTRDF